MKSEDMGSPAKSRPKCRAVIDSAAPGSTCEVCCAMTLAAKREYLRWD
jgi:hypothetical protein